MKRALSLGVVMAFSASFVYSQPEIEFKEKEHDFGKIKEENGVASYVFEFTNTGTEPLILNTVSASCGCTTPEWPKQPIAAGEKGTIKANYDTKNRPGPFNKSITIRSNAAEVPTAVLYIKGEVVARPKTVAETYPVLMGDIRLKSHISPLFDMFRGGASRTERIGVINISREDVKLSFAGMPEHVVLEAHPQVLNPNQEGEIIITYNPKNVADYGGRNDVAYVVLNDNQVLTDEYKLTINSNLREDFTTLTADQKANAPIASFSEKGIVIQVKKGSKEQASVTLENSGKSDLLIRAVKRGKGIARATLAKASLAPGKSQPLKIEVDATKLTGDTVSRVTVITNDYRTPTSIIVVTIKVID